ncbi:Cyclic nucleotide-gated olfactory channel [Branchiostoma belcheri]|nr:Cyclic nucleotide-gated olfactory channel [Branchiostoma belcheri]
MADDEYRWEGITLHGLFQQAATQHLHKTAAVFDNGHDTTVVTYSELAQAADNLCSVLTTVVPDIRGQSVGLYAKTALNLPLWVISILQLPACLVPIDPDSPHQLNNIHVPYILVQLEHMQGFLQNCSPLQVSTVTSPSLLQHGLFLVRVLGTAPTRCGSPLAYTLQTSGTTGQPKTVGVPHSCIVPNILHLRSLFEVTAYDVIFSASPLTFDPCIVELFLALSSGASLLMVPDRVKKAPKFLADVLVRRQQVTVLQATPSLVRRFGPELLQTRLLRADSPLRLLVFGGEDCPVPADIRAWRGPGNATQFYNIYGITEVSSWATLYRIPEEHISTGNSSRVPLGQPLLGTKLEVRNTEGKPVSEGRGVLYIGGDHRRCYLDGEDVTTQSLDIIMRSSGDIVDHHGDDLVFCGRLDDQVKRNGKRLDLRWIEQVGCRLAGVEACVAVMDKKDRLLLFVVLSAVNSQGQGRADDVLQALRAELPTHAVPDKVMEVTELPVTRHGKVDKEALLLSAKLDPPLTVVDRGTDMHQCVCDLWQRSGGILTTDREENQTLSFLTSGGDSLTAVQLVENLQDTFRHAFPHALDIILHQTLGDLVRYAQSVLQEKNNAQINGPSSSKLEITPEHILHESNSSSRKMSGGDKKSQEKRSVIRHSGEQLPKKMKTSEDSILRPVHKRTQVSQDVSRTNCGLAVQRGSQTVCLQPSVEENGQVHHIVPDVTSSTAAREDVSCLATEAIVSMETVWTCDTGKCVDASPLLITDVSWYPAGVVFIGSHSHRFCAVAMDTGDLLWETELGDRVESSACCSTDGELIIVGCYDNCVYVLESRTGAIRWRYHTGGAVKCSPCLDTKSSLVFVGSHDQHVHALDLKDQCCVWKTHCGGGSVFSSPCLGSSPRLLCVGTLTGTLIAINPDTGAVLWRTACPKPIFSSPCITPWWIYVGCVDGELYCMDHHGNITWNQGHLRWKFGTDSAVYATPFVFYIHAGSTRVLDSSGILNQKQSPNMSLPPAPSVDSVAKVRTEKDSTTAVSTSQGHWCVAVASTKGTLYILTLDSGSCLSSLTLPGEVFSSPVVWGDLLVVGCRDDLNISLQFQSKPLGGPNSRHFFPSTRATYHPNFITITCLDHEISKPEVQLQYHNKPLGERDNQSEAGSCLEPDNQSEAGSYLEPDNQSEARSCLEQYPTTNQKSEAG